MKITDIRRLEAAGRWAGAVLAAGAMSLALSACGSEESGAPAPTPTATSESPEDAAAAVQEDYWAAYVQIANSGAVDPQAFEGIADGRFVELDLKILREQADGGFVRVGAPSFSEFTADVDGDTATSLVCVDFSPWGSKNAQGEDLEIPKTPPSPFLATLEKRDESWVMTDQEYQEQTPCP